MKKILSFILANVLMLSFVACGNITAHNEKAELQSALTTFVSAEKYINPTWNTTKLLNDGNAAIAVWNVGANWEANAIAELDLVQQDVADIPNCNAQCEGLVVVFSGGLVTAIDIATSSTPVGTQAVSRGTALRARVLAKTGVTAIKTKHDYKKAWNAAITAQQLPTKYKL